MATSKWTLEAVNERLKVAKMGVTIRQRGDRLPLRATLPPKPGSEKQAWHQQSISLGIYAAGLTRAEAEAKILGGRIASGEFGWGQYLDLPDPEKKQDSKYWTDNKWLMSSVAEHLKRQVLTGTRDGISSKYSEAYLERYKNA